MVRGVKIIGISVIPSILSDITAKLCFFLVV